MAVFTATKVPAILLSPTEVPRDGCRREDREGAWEYQREARVRVLGYEVVSAKFARYVVLVTAPARRWKLRKRFKEFVTLAHCLGKEAPGEPWPALPPKRVFLFHQRKFDGAFLEERARSLDRWLKGVMRVPGALDLASVRDFFDIADFSLDKVAAQNLRMIFDVLDAKGDGEGKLERDQIKEATTMIGVSVSEAVLNMAMTEMDLNGDGLITFDEFKAIDIIFEHQEDDPPPPPPESDVDMHRVEDSSQGTLDLGQLRGPEPAVLYTSSTNASLVAEAEERRIKHILATKRVRFEIVYLDITVARRDELHDAISRTSSEALDVPFMVAQSAFVPIPRLVVRGKDVGGYAEIQALEDDRLLDAELEGVPRGEPYWAPPDEWDEEDRMAEGDHLRRVFERLGSSDRVGGGRRLTSEGMSAALALMGVASPLSAESPQSCGEETASACSSASVSPSFEEGRTMEYEQFRDWYEERSEVRLFEYLDANGNGALGLADLVEASRALGAELSPTELDSLATDLCGSSAEISVDVLEFLAWWAKHRGPAMPRRTSPRMASPATPLYSCGGVIRSPDALCTPDAPCTPDRVS